MKRKHLLCMIPAAILLLSWFTGCSEQKPASEPSESTAKAGEIILGKTILTVNAPCTIEIDGKTGRVDGSEVTGEIPFIDSHMFPQTPPETTVEISRENPISVQIDESYPFSLSVFNSWYSISVDANHPALVEASADLATVQVKESTELKYKLILNGCMVSFSGTVENLLQITREREGVYLVEGLSGSGTVRCECTDTYEVLAEQNYEAGENRSFRVSWNGKTATIQMDSPEPADSSNKSGAEMAGNTWIMVNAACTIEMNGKSGQIDGVTATGNLPIAKLTMEAPDDTNADSHVEIEGEGPIAVHIDEAREFSILIGNSQYTVSAEADQSALIEAYAAGASLKPTEATELRRFVFYLEDTVTLTVSGRVEELLRVTREREGVYLVEGLSGSGTVRCESTDTYEVLAEQNYEAGENRSFRVSWDGKTATITEANS